MPFHFNATSNYRIGNSTKAAEYAKKHLLLREAIHAVLFFDHLWHDYNIVTGYMIAYNTFEIVLYQLNIGSTQEDSTPATLRLFIPTASHLPWISPALWMRLSSSVTPSPSLVDLHLQLYRAGYGGEDGVSYKLCH